MKFFYDLRAVIGDTVSDVVLAVESGRIVGVDRRFDPAPGDETVDCGGALAVPGFIDLHVHGAGGYGCMSGDPAEVVDMCSFLARKGTTSVAPTTLAAPFDVLAPAARAISAAKRSFVDCDILGVFFEGPFLSPAKSGAQSSSDLCLPDEKNVERLLSLSDDILMVGAAPELPGAKGLARRLRDKNVVASIAHSDASFEQVECAVEWGFSDVTHLYNACSGAGKKDGMRTAGVVEAALACDLLTTQFIGDLRHLPTGLIKLIYHSKGASLAYAVTDGLEAAGLSFVPGEPYTQKNGVTVVYDDGVMKVADRSRLAGSVATMASIFSNLVKEVGVPLTDAVRMCSSTPARVAGLTGKKGELKTGADADIVLLGDDLGVLSVYKNGRLLV